MRKNIKFIKAMITTTLVLINVGIAISQNTEDLPKEYKWVETTTKGSKSSYRCLKNSIRNEAIYVNQKYDLKEIVKEYPAYAIVDPSFLGYKTNVHGSFLKAINTAINKEKVTELAKRNEDFELGFDLDQDGNILRIIFTLDTATLITSDELYNLEENIKKLFVFQPIRKVKVKLMGGFGVMTNFKEILAGEIPYIRKMEEQQRETERLFGN